MKLVSQNGPTEGKRELLIIDRDDAIEYRVLRVERASRKLPRTDPAKVWVPDRVIARTCTPDERPCVASNLFEMNWNSAMES